MQHFHLLIWIQDAPILGVNSNDEVASFIMKYCTCKILNKNASPTLFRRVNTYQRHTDNSYCLRKRKGTSRTLVCKFGYPRSITKTFVMRDVVSIVGRRKLKARSRLYDLPRNVEETFINDYNPAILCAWEGNMDIHYIGENSSTLNKCINKYVSKSEKSHDTDFDTINATKSLHTRLCNIAMRLLSYRECGAFEASDALIGISLHGTDPQTSIRLVDVRELRCRKLKTIKQVKTLDKESTDIFCPSLVDVYYPTRPKELESLSLYDFRKWYDVQKVQLKCLPKDESGKKKYFKWANLFI